MLRQAHIRRGLAGATLCVVLALSLVPPALAYYRCNVAGTTHAQPCCAKARQAASTDDACVRPAACCARETVAVERAAAESQRTRSWEPLAFPASASPAAHPLLAGAEAPAVAGARLDLRQRVHEQTCSLLI